jgi:hypothetical protein
MFQLSEEEADEMVSQNAIPSKQHMGGSLPNVFSEHGVLMLANILKSERAIQVSIKLVECQDKKLALRGIMKYSKLLSI